MNLFATYHSLLSSRHKEWKQLDPGEEQPLEVTNSLSNIKITDTYHQNCLAQKQGATADCMFQLKADKQRLQNWSSLATLGLVPPTILLSQKDHQYLLGPNSKGGGWEGKHYRNVLPQHFLKFSLSYPTQKIQSAADPNHSDDSCKVAWAYSPSSPDAFNEWFYLNLTVKSWEHSSNA